MRHAYLSVRVQDKNVLTRAASTFSGLVRDSVLVSALLHRTSVAQKKAASLYRWCGSANSDGKIPEHSRLVGALSPVIHKGLHRGLRETFIKRYIVKRTNKAEIRPKEQTEKAESCRDNLWNEVQFKGP